MSASVSGQVNVGSTQRSSSESRGRVILEKLCQAWVWFRHETQNAFRVQGMPASVTRVRPVVLGPNLVDDCS